MCRKLRSLTVSIIFVVIISISTTAAFNTVGSVCHTDDDCSGPNEHCLIETNFDPPCTTGHCSCLPCHVINGSYVCSPIEILKVGDYCDPATDNHIFEDENAFCSTDICSVECRYGDPLQETGPCPVRPSSFSLAYEAEPCNRTSDCLTGLICSIGKICLCPHHTEAYNANTSLCSKRELGDPCRSDLDCQVKGSVNSGGFTWESGSCSSRSMTCACGYDGFQTSVSFVHGEQLVTKPICVASGARVNLEKMSACNIDPILAGDANDAQICAEDLICSRCPEDAFPSLNLGKCRSGFLPPPRIYCPPAVTVIEVPCPNRTSTISGFDAYQNSTEIPVTQHQQAVSKIKTERATLGDSSWEVPATVEIPEPNSKPPIVLHTASEADTNSSVLEPISMAPSLRNSTPEPDNSTLLEPLFPVITLNVSVDVPILVNENATTEATVAIDDQLTSVASVTTELPMSLNVSTPVQPTKAMQHLGNADQRTATTDASLHETTELPLMLIFTTAIHPTKAFQYLENVTEVNRSQNNMTASEVMTTQAKETTEADKLLTTIFPEQTTEPTELNVTTTEEASQQWENTSLTQQPALNSSEITSGPVTADESASAGHNRNDQYATTTQVLDAAYLTTTVVVLSQQHTQNSTYESEHSTNFSAATYEHTTTSSQLLASPSYNDSTTSETTTESIDQLTTSQLDESSGVTSSLETTEQPGNASVTASNELENSTTFDNETTEYYTTTSAVSFFPLDDNNTDSPSSTEENVSQRGIVTTTVPKNVGKVPLFGACSSDSDCAQNQQCHRLPCGAQCLCKTGYALDDDNSTCFQVPELKLADSCSELSANETQILPPHTVCQNSRVACNPFYKEEFGECIKLDKGGYGDPCGLGFGSCISTPSAELWCDHDTKTCLCYDLSPSVWNDATDSCVRPYFGSKCSVTMDCGIFGDLQTGGYTYGGGACVQGRCGCSPSYVEINFSYYLDDDVQQAKTAPLVKTKTICVHSSATLNVPVGGACTLDPIYRADNRLGMTSLCAEGLVCSRCGESAVSLSQLANYQGVCTCLTDDCQ